jgi:PAS domain S-box-containing protein
LSSDAQTHFEQLMGSIDGIFWEADAQTLQLTYVSEQAAHLLGYPVAEWLKPDFWLTHIHEDDRAQALTCCRQVVTAGGTSHVEYRMRKSDGQWLWLRNTASAITEAGLPIKLRGITINITEQKLAAEAAQTHLWFLESMDKVNRAIQGANDLEQMMRDVLDAVLAVFACDRAWLLYPCDPTASTWCVPMERTQPAYPGAFAAGMNLPSDPYLAQVSQIVRTATGPVTFGSGATYPLLDAAAAQYQIQSQMSLAIYPKIDQPYIFGLHQCAYPRQWTPQEERLFQEIGRRLADALTTLLIHRRLQENELRYREVFENSADVMAITEVTTDHRFRLLDLNPAWEKILGVNRTTLIGHYLDEYSIEPIAQTIGADLLTCLEKKVQIDLERELETPTGQWSMQLTLTPVSNSDGAIYRIISIGRNITAQKQAEDKLRASEARFRTFLDHATDAFFLHDEWGVIVDVNRQACESLGYTQAELIGLNPLAIDPDMNLPFLIRLGARLANGETVNFESRHRHKDGTTFPVEVRMRAFWENGRQFGVALVQDITERKRSAQALLESHSLLKAVVDGTTDSIFVKDRQGRYLMINAAGAQTMGKTVAEMIGKDDRELFPPAIAHVLIERDQQILATGEAQVFEEIETTDNSTRMYLTTKSVYRDANGVVSGLIGIAREITELKQLEEQFRQAQKMEAVGRLAGGIAHDFNNLLTVINGYSQLIGHRLLPTDPNRARLVEIQKAGERAANLTRQLLAFSRKQLLQPQVVDLNALLQELLKLLRRLIGEDIEVVLTPAADLGTVKVDPSQFEQAIINLAVNARDAMPQGGRLTLTTTNVVLAVAPHSELPAGHYACVTISDTGIGMTEAVKARIFEPFFTTKGPGQGTGLGLAMVYGFVKQSGGHVEVASTLGHGATFTIYLPHTGEDAAEMQALPDLGQAPTGTETILLVEDEDAVRNLVRIVLQAGHYQVLEAHDGQEAILVAKQHQGPIHLLITDLVMPRMSGRHLAVSLKQSRPDLAVLFMSGYTDEMGMAEETANSHIAFIQKPFNPITLAQQVRALLDT